MSDNDELIADANRIALIARDTNLDTTQRFCDSAADVIERLVEALKRSEREVAHVNGVAERAQAHPAYVAATCSQQEFIRLQTKVVGLYEQNHALREFLAAAKEYEPTLTAALVAKYETKEPTEQSVREMLACDLAFKKLNRAEDAANRVTAPVSVVRESIGEHHGYEVFLEPTSGAWLWFIVPIEKCACGPNDDCEHGPSPRLSGVAPDRGKAWSVGVRVAKIARHMTKSMDW